MALSQQGGHYGYLASDGAAQTLTIDGKVVPSNGSIIGDSLGFSPDGSPFAYVVSRAGRPGMRPALVLMVGGMEMTGITLNETRIANIPATSAGPPAASIRTGQRRRRRPIASSRMRAWCWTAPRHR